MFNFFKTILTREISAAFDEQECKEKIEILEEHQKNLVEVLNFIDSKLGLGMEKMSSEEIIKLLNDSEMEDKEIIISWIHQIEASEVKKHLKEVCDIRDNVSNKIDIMQTELDGLRN